MAEAAKRGEVDLSLVSVDSTTTRAHHDAAGVQLDEEVLTALEKAAEEEKPKGAMSKDKTGDLPTVTPPGRSDAACEGDTDSG